eukprot:TRINITY_DN8921_c0_g1_i1.p1 TRINITY_DN8921_c0_g1~~TRINITY_DN8921_c0_g1_i1.p1  ORF type:complete len:1059 (+),score=135.13 TRINITY_DN8921_c0_g1_i1:63-3239(+)
MFAVAAQRTSNMHSSDTESGSETDVTSSDDDPTDDMQMGGARHWWRGGTLHTVVNHLQSHIVSTSKSAVAKDNYFAGKPELPDVLVEHELSTGARFLIFMEVVYVLFYGVLIILVVSNGCMGARVGDMRLEDWAIYLTHRCMPAVLSAFGIGFTAVLVLQVMGLSSMLVAPTRRHLAIYMWAQFIFKLVESALVVREYSDDEQGVATFDLLAGASAIAVTSLQALAQKEKAQNCSKESYSLDIEQKNLSKKLFGIFCDMIPEFAAVRLLNTRDGVLADSLDHVSILFVSFNNFDTISCWKRPDQLLGFLNKYFFMFDNLCSRQQVTKIETVLDEFVAAVGVSPEDLEEANVYGHAKSLERLLNVALEILNLQWKVDELLDEQLLFKMGMHSGPVVAGVVGGKLPRFRLFGDTINTAARMKQNGEPGKLQFGEQTYADIPVWAARMTKPRSSIEMKGKGFVNTFLLTPPLRSDILGGRSGTFSHIPRAPLVASGTVLSLISNTQRFSFESEADGDEESNTADGDPHGKKYENLLQRFSDLGVSASAFDEDGIDVQPEYESRARKASSSTLTGWFAQRVCQMSYHEAFSEWYHTDVFCRDLGYRLYREGSVFAVVSILEALYLFCNGDPCGCWQRLFDFISIRVFCICIRLMCFCVVHFTNLVHRSRVWSQRLMLIAWLLQAVLVMRSYMTMNFCFQRHDQYTHDLNHGKTHFALAGTSKNILLLCCIPTYTFLLREHPFSLFHSLVYLPLGCLLPHVLLRWYGIQEDSDETIGCGSYGMNPIFSTLLFQFGFVFLNVIHVVHAAVDENNLRKRFLFKQGVEMILLRVNDCLNTLVPELILLDLRNKPNQASLQHWYSRATVAQSDLCGFTAMASARRPEEVVQFVSQIFGLFDRISDDLGVYKVETVGDAYIAAQAEQPLTQRNSPKHVVEFGCRMVEAVENWAIQHGENVTCRVGVHYGSCVGGMVGSRAQRYHLFGDLMTDLDILESTAPQGRVQVSFACRKAVQQQEEDMEEPERESRRSVRRLVFEGRSEGYLITSKGSRYEFDDVGGRPFLVVY